MDGQTDVQTEFQQLRLHLHQHRAVYLLGTNLPLYRLQQQTHKHLQIETRLTIIMKTSTIYTIRKDINK